MQTIVGLVVSITVLLILPQPSYARRRVDCTKFVFAPICRGVAAKRAGHAERDIEDHLESAFSKERDYGQEEMSGFGLTEIEDYSDPDLLPLDNANFEPESHEPQYSDTEIKYIRLASKLWPRLKEMVDRKNKDDLFSTNHQRQADVKLKNAIRRLLLQKSM